MQKSKFYYVTLSAVTLGSQFLCGYYLFKLSKFLPLSSAFGIVTGKSYGFLMSSLGGVYAMKNGK